ncbi:MAG: hypothetical protein ACI4L9_05255 [Candidatus Coproplasma sp.]
MDFFEFTNFAAQFIRTNNDPFRGLWLSLLIGGLCYAIIYVFQAVALYTIASREGFKHKWMAFIPFFNTYYIGVLSEKNKIYNQPPRRVALVQAVLEVILVALFVLYYVCAGIIFAGGFYKSITESYVFGGTTIELLVGYEVVGLPDQFYWIGWIFAYMQTYITSWLQLIYVLLNVFVLISFFQTYCCRRYVLFSLLSVFLPVKGVLFFVVRNNRGMNYRDFIREQQQRQYRMYQEYNRQSGGNPYGYGPYSGQPYNRTDNPYGGSGGSGSASDPFGEFGSSSGGSSGSQSSGGSSASGADDPFDDFK